VVCVFSQAMLAASRDKWTGIQLEVNEGILDSCNQLMKVKFFLVKYIGLPYLPVVCINRFEVVSMAAFDIFFKNSKYIYVAP
jgi:hypothetical protein